MGNDINVVFDANFWIIVITVCFAIIAIFGIFQFGLKIYFHKFSDFWDRINFIVEELLIHRGRGKSNDLHLSSQLLQESLESFLERRNKFWELFGQIALSVVVITIVAVLLLSKTIDADAGLPILSAIVAFVIGKGIDTKGKNRSLSGSPKDDNPDA